MSNAELLRVAPPGQALCPHCLGTGTIVAAGASWSWDCEEDCIICEGSGLVAEAFAAEWQDALDERADYDELQHLEQFQDWIQLEDEREASYSPGGPVGGLK